jgi:hypothetical protein
MLTAQPGWFKGCSFVQWLLPLMLAHGLVRRVCTIQIEVKPLGGESFSINLDASTPTVGEAKTEIFHSQGTAEARQELYKVAERADGLAVREDDADSWVIRPCCYATEM